MRARAAAQLGKHRPLARETVAALALALGDPDVGVQASAATALAEIGPLLAERPEWAEVAVSPAIIGLDDSAKIALPLQEFLGHLGAAGKPAVPALHRYSNFKGLKQRLGAIQALIKLDPEHAEELLPGLLGLLGESDPQVRGEGLTALGKIGAKGKPAAPKVIALLDGDPDPGIRIEAAQTLVNISPADSTRAVSGLVAVIKDIDEQTSGKLKPPPPGPGGRVALDPAAVAHPLYQPRTAAALLLKLDRRRRRHGPVKPARCSVRTLRRCTARASILWMAKAGCSGVFLAGRLRQQEPATADPAAKVTKGCCQGRTDQRPPAANRRSSWRRHLARDGRRTPRPPGRNTRMIRLTGTVEVVTPDGRAYGCPPQAGEDNMVLCAPRTASRGGKSPPARR